MTLQLIPEVSNFVFYAFVAIVVGAGIVAAAVVFAAMFRGVMQ